MPSPGLMHFYRRTADTKDIDPPGGRPTTTRESYILFRGVKHVLQPFEHDTANSSSSTNTSASGSLPVDALFPTSPPMQGSSSHTPLQSRTMSSRDPSGRTQSRMSHICAPAVRNIPGGSRILSVSGRGGSVSSSVPERLRVYSPP